MDADALAVLSELGKQLDANVYPCVTNGGLVVLNESTVPSTLSMEANHGRQEKRGPAAGSRQGDAGWQRPSGGPWPSGAPASVVRAGSEAQYDAELGGLVEQYPEAQFWHLKEGIWLLTKSRVLHGLRQHALFLTGISFPKNAVRSWAFWTDPIARPTWIGPRHTNFNDGSICAFEPFDGTWVFGDSLVALFDLYSVWALRHLYLECFGRWPGHQAIHFPGERILELRPDEHCGCRHSDNLYSECCMPADLASNRISACLMFFWQTGGFRAPPQSVVDFVRHGQEIPSIASLIP
jgi:hypothetical protein